MAGKERYWRERYTPKWEKKMVRQNTRRREQVPPGWRKLGFTFEDYDRVLKEQGGVCDICKNPPPLPRVRSDGRVIRGLLHLDHDHGTGEVRGLLCWSCNSKLGWVEKYLPTIVKYIRRYK